MCTLYINMLIYSIIPSYIQPYIPVHNTVSCQRGSSCAFWAATLSAGDKSSAETMSAVGPSELSSQPAASWTVSYTCECARRIHVHVILNFSLAVVQCIHVACISTVHVHLQYCWSQFGHETSHPHSPAFVVHTYMYNYNCDIMFILCVYPWNILQYRYNMYVFLNHRRNGRSQ